MRVHVIAAVGSALVATIAAEQASAQTPPPQLPYGIGNAVREGEQTRRQALPGSPSMPALPRLVEPQLTLKDKETLRVRRFKVEGPNLVDEAEVRAALAPYEGRTLTIAQIYEAADGVTTIYRTHG
jgi:hemolysin activation/secretion protein